MSDSLVARSQYRHVETAPPFSALLSGKNAFYDAPDYLETTRKDFSATKTLPATYACDTENKIIRIAKQVFAILIFPIGIYQLLHNLAGYAILPASCLNLPDFILNLPILKSAGLEFRSNHVNLSRSEIPIDGQWKYKRLTIEVDGYKVDATIVGKASTLGNGRWVLASSGNGEFYEDTLASSSHELKQIMSEVDGNAIVFNYPGVGASAGMPNRAAMAKAYRAVLTFLEDKEKGVGAKEIIGYGHSLGGAVQGDALLAHRLKTDVKYVFVKSRTFSNLEAVAASLTGNSILGFLVKVLGWNIDVAKSSKRLKVPEIILQTAEFLRDEDRFFDFFDGQKAMIELQQALQSSSDFNMKLFSISEMSSRQANEVKNEGDQTYEELSDSSRLCDDGVIQASVSLAKALLDDEQCLRTNKCFIGISDFHNGGLSDPANVAKRIKAFLTDYPKTLSHFELPNLD